MFMANTDIDDLVYCGIDDKQRRLYFGNNIDLASSTFSEVTMSSVECAVRGLHLLANQDCEKPIELHMCSPGGDPYAMLRLYDEILACPCPVKFFGGGLIQSSATWIMCACDERYLHPNTTVMVHDGNEVFDGTHTDTKIAMSEAIRLQNVLYDIYAANSKMPRSFWEDLCQRDLYLTAEETIQLGLADGLIKPKNRSRFRHVRNSNLKRSAANSNELVDTLYKRVNRHNSSVTTKFSR